MKQAQFEVLTATRLFAMPLTDEERMIYFFVSCNPMANATGLFMLSVEDISLFSRRDIRTVQLCLEALEGQGLLVADQGAVFVPAFFTAYNWRNNSTVVAGAVKTYNDFMKNRPLCRAFTCWLAAMDPEIRDRLNTGTPTSGTDTRTRRTPRPHVAPLPEGDPHDPEIPHDVIVEPLSAFPDTSQGLFDTPIDTPSVSHTYPIDTPSVSHTYPIDALEAPTYPRPSPIKREEEREEREEGRSMEGGAGETMNPLAKAAGAVYPLDATHHTNTQVPS